MGSLEGTDLILVTDLVVDPDPGERGELLMYVRLGQRVIALTGNVQ